MRGLFITLEGPDGSGKSTIAKGLGEYLRNKGLDFITTREPGGTLIGEEIRDIVLDKKNSNISWETEALLYAAARGQHVEEKIIPSLEKGNIVLCERFVLSSLAYQGVGRNLGINNVKAINDFATKGLQPDLILFFHVDPELTLKRKTLKKSGDRLEEEGNDFHKLVYEGYMELIQTYPENIKIIDATRSVEEVLEQSIKEVGELLNKKGVMR